MFTIKQKYAHRSRMNMEDPYWPVNTVRLKPSRKEYSSADPWNTNPCCPMIRIPKTGITKFMKVSTVPCMAGCLKAMKLKRNSVILITAITLTMTTKTCYYETRRKYFPSRFCLSLYKFKAERQYPHVYLKKQEPPINSRSIEFGGISSLSMLKK